MRKDIDGIVPNDTTREIENGFFREGDNGSSFEVPLGSFLFDAEYSRNGQDLVLKDEAGREVVLDGYFTFDIPPQLVNEMGAMVAGEFAVKLAGPGQFAQSGDANSSLGAVVGTIETIEGSATVRHTDGTSEVLQPGSDIYKDDIIETGGDGTLGLLMVDGSVLGVGPGSRMAIDNFAYDASTSDGNLGLSFLKGTVSFLSGKIAKNDYDDVDIKVPFGSIGIRGTEFVVEIAADGAATVSVIDGRVYTAIGNQEMILEPGQLISLAAAGLSGVELIAIAAIQAKYGRVLDAQRDTIIIRDGRKEENEDLQNINSEAGSNIGAPAGAGNSEPDNENTPSQSTPNTDPIRVVEPEAEVGRLAEFLLNLNVNSIGDDLGASDDLGALVAENFAAAVEARINEIDNNSPLFTPVVNFSGSDKDDVFEGSLVDNIIEGKGGNDILLGAAGNDTVKGDVGNDAIFGGVGDDNLSGGEGDDTIDGGVGQDYLQGGEGSADLLLGGDGDDVIYGDDEEDPNPLTGDHDTLFGDAGNDSLYGGGGNDLILGGTGADLIQGGSGNDALDGGQGTDIANFLGQSSDYVILPDASGFIVVDALTGDTDTLVNIEQVSFDNGTFSLVTVGLSGSSVVSEGNSASYTISLGGTPLVSGQSVSVDIGISNFDASSSDYANFLTAVQTAANGAAGVSFDGVSTLVFRGGAGNAVEIDISLAALSDLAIEGNEDYRLSLSSPVGNGPSGNEVLVIVDGNSVDTEIVDLSAANIRWTIQENSNPVVEGGDASYTIEFAGATITSDHSVSIYVSLNSGDTSSADFEENLSKDLQDAAASVTGVSVVGTTLIFDDTAASSFTFDLPTFSDGLGEGDESFSIAISDPKVDGSISGIISGSASQATTIIDAASDLIAFSLSGAVSAIEGGTASYNVAYDGVLQAGETVSVSISLSHIETDPEDVSALFAALDEAIASTSGVTLNGNVLTFDSSAASLAFDLDISIDGLIEGAESFIVSLDSASSLTGVNTTINGSFDSVTTTIASNGAVAFSITGSSSILEGSVASYSVAYEGTLPDEETASIDIDLTNISADGSDYSDIVAALSFAAGSTAGVSFDGVNMLTFTGGVGNSSVLDFDLSVFDGDGVEDAQTFSIDLSNPVSSFGGPASVDPSATSALTEITDNDGSIGFAISAAPLILSEEAAESTTFTLTMSGGPLVGGNVATVDIDPSGSASDGVDYSSFYGALDTAIGLEAGVIRSGSTLTFTSGFDGNLEFTVSAIDDGNVEGTETIIATLSNESIDSGTISIVTPIASVDLNDADGSIGFAISAAPLILSEE
ncbi:MAG: FecR domain-containing protein, partial [Sneathiella sp.]